MTSPHHHPFPSIILISAFITILSVSASGQLPSPDEGWPRAYQIEAGKIIVYQPQIEKWDNYSHLTAQAAIQVIPKGKTTGVYGAVKLEMDTETNMQTRMVLLKNVQVKDLRFPGTPDDQAESARAIYMEFVSGQSEMMISLDRVISAMGCPKFRRRMSMSTLHRRKYSTVKNRPSWSFSSESQSSRQQSRGFAANTNWDLFLNPTGGITSSGMISHGSPLGILPKGHGLRRKIAAHALDITG
ncbi:hypothetical protein HS121_17625 [bacterium]|nr:hypothetical protein [bacterium]